MRNYCRSVDDYTADKKHLKKLLPSSSRVRETISIKSKSNGKSYVLHSICMAIDHDAYTPFKFQRKKKTPTIRFQFGSPMGPSQYRDCGLSLFKEKIRVPLTKPKDYSDSARLTRRLKFSRGSGKNFEARLFILYYKGAQQNTSNTPTLLHQNIYTHTHTEIRFLQVCRFFRAAPLSPLHRFSFNPRPPTPAPQHHENWSDIYASRAGSLDTHPRGERYVSDVKFYSSFFSTSFSVFSDNSV